MTTIVSFKPRKIREGDTVVDGWDGVDYSRPVKTIERVSYLTTQLIVTYYDDPGYVYVFRSANGLVKIGKALRWKHRLKTLSLQSPLALIPVFVLRSATYSEIEKALHRALKSHRKQGEWFDLSDEVIQSIPDRIAEIDPKAVGVSF